MFPDASFRTLILPNFYPHAAAMRERFDAHFAEPDHHDHRHFCWNYWYVPDHYMYLRSHARAILGDLVDDFLRMLRAYVAKELGLHTVREPLLSVYVNGCFQTTHSDMLNGSYAYVFSLTDWDNRSFRGGETLVARENVFDRMAPREPRGQGNYFEVIPSRFNQLLLFDDRLAHLVPVVQGQMDPRQARIVLHGHIY